MKGGQSLSTDDYYSVTCHKDTTATKESNPLMIVVIETAERSDEERAF